MTRYWFVSTKYRRNSMLALVTFIFAFAVILLGAYTRLTNAGLSCPDWPHCYGYITAPTTPVQIEQAAQKFPATPVDIKRAWTEMTHRYAAGITGILIIILSLSILFARKAKDLKAIFIALGLITLLALQVMLGMLTVTEKLKPMIVVAHLLTGLSILSLLWWAYLDLQIHDDFFVKHTGVDIIFWFWLALVMVFAQITLGGWVSTHYAGLACIDFPYCNGKLLPTLQWHQIHTDLITIHMMHRIGAVITGIYLVILSLFLLRNVSFRSMAILILALVALQITLGVLNIIWLRPVWIALIHHATAIILLLTIITALVKAHIESRETQYGFRMA